MATYNKFTGLVNFTGTYEGYLEKKGSGKLIFATISGGTIPQSWYATGETGHASDTNYTVAKDGAKITITEKKDRVFADAVGNVTVDGNEFVLKANTGLTARAQQAASDNSVYFHVGANSNQVINTEFNNMSAVSLGIAFEAQGVTVANLGEAEKLLIGEDAEATVNNGTGTSNTQFALNISTRAGANKAIEVIDNAIKMVSEERSKYGAIQNRLEYTMNNLNTTAENMTAAESTIRDVDMAEEMMEYTKNNILQQAAQSMLSQAMARPQQALQLLR